MTSAIHQIVTFADDVFAGNPAFVLVNSRPLPQLRFQQVAQQLREPVLAEISGEGDDLRLRFTTPNGPHAGAGHAAHAAAYVAFEQLRPATDEIRFALDDGKALKATRGSRGPGVTWPMMPFQPVDLADQIAACIGVRPLETLRAPFGFVAVLRSNAEVAAVVPDLEKIAALEATTLTVTARDDAGDFAIRVFAPRVGLPEDPVCGTAHRIIVPMWSERLGKTDLVSRQLSPRGGTLYCHFEPGTVTLSGAATPFLSGQLMVDL